MNLRSSLLYALRLVFPPKHGQVNTNGRRSLFAAMLCIGISLVPLVAVLVISDGMIEGITGRMISLGSNDICVSLNEYGSECDSAENLYATAERFKNVSSNITGAFPEIQGSALASANGSRSGATLRGMQKDIFKTNESFKILFKVIEGQTEFQSSRSAVIGQKIAQTLNLHAGDSFTLICIDSSSNNFVPKVLFLKVAGIISCGYQELDALWVFIPLESALKFLPKANSSYSIGLSTNVTFDPKLTLVSQLVQKDAFGLGIHGNPEITNAYVYTWNEINSSEYENFSSTKMLLLLIMILIVLVASVNISSALIMLVMERKKEIAILKSIGGSSFGVSYSFLLSGFACGLGGVFIGLPLGLLLAVNVNSIICGMEKVLNFFVKFSCFIFNKEFSSVNEIHILDPAYYLTDIPISVPFKELFIIVLVTLLLSLFVSAIPAFKAGKEKPLDTLRKM